MYPGTYDDYVWNLGQEVFVSSDEESKHMNVTSSPADRVISDTQMHRNEQKKRDARLRQIRKRLEDLDQKISAQQNDLAVLNDRVVAGDQNPETYKILGIKHSELETIENEWMTLMEEKETIEKL